MHTRPLHNLDLHAPGALEQLLAFHRNLFGGWRMAEDGGDGGPGDDGYKPPATQADLDRIISDRLTRERAKFADYDDLKSKAEQFEALEQASRTDQERAVETARAEATRSERERANGRLVTAEARALAAEQRFRNPALAVKAIDLADVKVGDDGEIDVDAIKSKLKALSDSEPYLVDDGKPNPKPDPSQGGGGATDDKPSVARGRDMFNNRKAAKKAS